MALRAALTLVEIDGRRIIFFPLFPLTDYIIYSNGLTERDSALAIGQFMTTPCRNRMINAL